jgi:hypothetical protein
MSPTRHSQSPKPSRAQIRQRKRGGAADVETEFVARGDAPLEEDEVRALFFHSVWKQGLQWLALMACAVYLLLAARKLQAEPLVSLFHLGSFAAAACCVVWLAIGREAWRQGFAVIVALQCAANLGMYVAGWSREATYSCAPTSGVLYVVTSWALSYMRWNEEKHKLERKKMAARIFDEVKRRE